MLFLTPSESEYTQRRGETDPFLFLLEQKEAKNAFGVNSLDLECAVALGAPMKMLRVSSPAGSSLEMKPGARVACQVTVAVVFLVLLVTAIAFAGECRGAHHRDNVSVPSPRRFGSLHLCQVHLRAPDEDKIKARRCPLQVRDISMSAETLLQKAKPISSAASFFKKQIVRLYPKRVFLVKKGLLVSQASRDVGTSPTKPRRLQEQEKRFLSALPIAALALMMDSDTLGHVWA